MSTFALHFRGRNLFEPNATTTKLCHAQNINYAEADVKPSKFYNTDFTFQRLTNQAGKSIQSCYMHLHHCCISIKSDESVVKGSLSGANSISAVKSAQIRAVVISRISLGRHSKSVNTLQVVKAVAASDIVHTNRKSREGHTVTSRCCVIGWCFLNLSLLSLQNTGMVNSPACFSICIFSSRVPYLLLSLHVTTSTAIKAVDDNQSAN